MIIYKCENENVSTVVQSMRAWQVSSVQSLRWVWLFVTLWTAAYQASLSITNSRSLLKCPLSWWCHPTISSSVVPFSSGLQSFPSSVSFPMSQFSTSGGQSIGLSAAASNEYSGLITLRKTRDMIKMWI